MHLPHKVYADQENKEMQKMDANEADLGASTNVVIRLSGQYLCIKTIRYILTIIIPLQFCWYI